MIESKVSQELYKEFNQINRNLTYLTIGLVCLVALIVWFFSIDVGGKRASLMGVAFMVLAVITYKIPYLSYQYLLRKYKSDNEKCSVLGHDWKQFNNLAMQSK